MATWLRIPSNAGVVGCSTPDIAALAGADTLDLEVEVALDDWAALDTAVSSTLVSQWGADGNRAFIFFNAQAGAPNDRLVMSASEAGLGVAPSFSSPETNFAAFSRRWVAARFTAVNPLNPTQSICQFQTSPDGVVWTNFGGLVTHTTELITGLFNSTATVHIGDPNLTLAGGPIGNFYRVRIRADGVLIASPDFTALPIGMVAGNTFADAQGNTWTLQGPAIVMGTGEGRDRRLTWRDNPKHISQLDRK